MQLLKKLFTSFVCLATIFSASAVSSYTFNVRGYSNTATAELDCSQMQTTCYAGTRFLTTVEVYADIHGTYKKSDGTSTYVNTQPDRCCGQAVANISKNGAGSKWNYVSGLHLVYDGSTTIGSYTTRKDF